MVTGSADGVTLNAEKMEKFDYLVATAIREGFYLTTDLYSSRAKWGPIKWRQIGVDRDGDVHMQLFKALCAVYEPAFENWCAFARNFLEHVNPYTGRAYKDEPAMPLLSLVNEGALGWCAAAANDERVRDAWRTWLREKRSADPSFCPSADPAKPSATAWPRTGGAAEALFIGEVETKMAARMRAFLRGIGCKALLTNRNNGPCHPPLQLATVQYDYLDGHPYIDHPTYLSGWKPPIRYPNENPIQMDKMQLATCAFSRMADKPWVVTEWNFCHPGKFRGMGGMLTGAMAALQDWDGLWHYAYAGNREELFDDTDLQPTCFSLCNDPLALASDRAAIMLFLRGDIATIPPGQGVSFLVEPLDKMLADGRPPEPQPSWMNAAWNMRVSACLTPEAAGRLKVIPQEEAETPAVKAWARNAPANQDIRFDRERGSFTIQGQRTCGGFAPEGSLEAGPLRFNLAVSGEAQNTAVSGEAQNTAVSGEAQDTPATVWASSLDGAPVASSGRILLAHLTDVQVEGAKFATSKRNVLLEHGSIKSGKGYLARNSAAQVSLALGRPHDYAVYGLDMGGARLGSVPSEVRDGRLEFTASVAGPQGARMFYEIVRK